MIFPGKTVIFLISKLYYSDLETFQQGTSYYYRPYTTREKGALMNNEYLSGA